MLQPNHSNKTFHAITRSKAKMYEFSVPADRHINLGGVSLTDLLDLTIGMLGSLAASAPDGEIGEEKYRLTFSSQYFLALLEARIETGENDLLRLLAASGFYLADYPGSSQVIQRSVDVNNLSGLELILLSVLKRERFNLPAAHPVDSPLGHFRAAWEGFINGAQSIAELQTTTQELRNSIYKGGSDKDLLLVDLMRSISLKHYFVSAKNILERHSGAHQGAWDEYFRREDSIKELWPSQIRLAERGIFSGSSAIIQMPTSAGKTKAAEFIVRSCFLANRGNLSVIVAPFRALCQEIYNDFKTAFGPDQNIQVGLISDVLEDDIEDVLAERQKSVLILTPEKLDFLLRYNPDLAARISLMIYDEGHLFDDTSRGIKYELLLASLKSKLPDTAQVVLISAVISNAQEVKEWLLDETSVLVDGKDLSPTSRNIVFVEWTQRNRFLQFVDDTDIQQNLFFVPAILQSHQLEMRGNETVERFYPMPDRRTRRYPASQIAGFLGVRLASSGLSAVFTGRKDSAQKIAKELIAAYDRRLPIEQPLRYSEAPGEAEKVIAYIHSTLGEDSLNTKAAQLGILLHHGNIPHGLRLVTEYALQKQHFKLVICTSTLAQGVNLPIRYLVVSSERQGRETMKTRDFHNLMGRAGRSGKYTEGTVIFADPEIYRSRNQANKRRWLEVGSLLNPSNSEPSRSRLLKLLENPQGLDEEELETWRTDVADIRDGVESYLMDALANINNIQEMENVVSDLARNTLGYSQIANDEDKVRLVVIFIEIGTMILTRIPELEHRPIYSRSILNLTQSNEVLEVLRTLTGDLLAEDSDLLEVLWPLIYRFNKNSILRSFSEADSLILCRSWMSGSSIPDICSLAAEMERTARGQLTTIQTVELCEAGFSYGSATLLSSLSELITLTIPEDNRLGISTTLLKLQKLMKYGVPSLLQVNIYELGLSDRRLCAQIADSINTLDELFSKRQIIESIEGNALLQEQIRREYPAYFSYRLDSLSV